MKTRITIVILLLLSIGLVAKLYLLQNEYDVLLSSLVDDSLDENALYVEDFFLGNDRVILYNGIPFLALDALIEAFDDTVTLSNSGQRIYIDYASMAFRLPDAKLSTFVETSMPAINVPLIYVDDTAYVALETVCRLYGYDYVFIEATNSYLMYGGASEVMEVTIPKSTQTYKPLNDAYVKYQKTSLEQNGYVLDERDGYQMVLSGSGHLVYIDKNLSGHNLTAATDTAYVPTEVDSGEAISLTWEAIESYSGNFSKLETSFESGINVVSPTWFNLNINGILINSAEMTYVDKAHESGIRVWGLFKNNFDPDWTHDLLINETDMDYAIAQLVFYSAFYELDGINFDFENIYLEDQEGLSAFISKASDYLKLAGLTVSIDVTRPGGSDQWSKVYDREAIARFVDYVCLMAYDEFWGSSPVSGPVASLPWTEESITLSLESIPSEKLILGIPLYMRVWEETKNSSGSYVKTGSRAITLSGYENIKAQKNLTISWDASAEQNYAEYFENGKRYRIWIEDESALIARLNLANKYSLPGIASWRRGYGSELSDQLYANWLNERQ